MGRAAPFPPEPFSPDTQGCPQRLRSGRRRAAAAFLVAAFALFAFAPEAAAQADLDRLDPENVQVNVGESKLTILWDLNANPEPSYPVSDWEVAWGEEGQGVAFGSRVVSLLSTARDREVTGLANGTKYWIAVRGLIGGGGTATGRWVTDGDAQVSNPAATTILFTPGTPATPGMVQNVTVTDITQTGFTISWDMLAGADGYKVQWVKPPQTFTTATEAVIDRRRTTSHTVSNLDPGVTYAIRVIATRVGATDGPESSTRTATTLPIASAAIHSTNPSPLTEEGMLDDATLTVDLIGVEYVQSPTTSHFALNTDPEIFGLSVGSVSRTSNARAVLTLDHDLSDFDGDPDVELTVTVKAAAHTGSTDLTTAAVTVDAVDAPAKVTGVTLTPGDGQITVAWNAAANADQYSVEWRSGANYDPFAARAVSGQYSVPSFQPREYVIDGLADATQYTVRVSAGHDQAPPGEYSDEETATTAPGQVTGVQAAAGTGAGELDVSWNAVTGAGGYKVQWKSGSQSFDSSREDAVSGGATASHTITGLTGGTAHDVRVIATLTDAPDGTPSDAATATPPPAPSQIVLSLDPTEVREDAGATTVTVTAAFDTGAGALSADTVVTVSVGGGTATSVTDYAPVTNFNITIPQGATSATGTFSFAPVDDSDSEGNETVDVTGTTALSGVTVAKAALTLADDDISAAISGTNRAGGLTEANLHGATLTVDLSAATFANNLQTSHFTLTIGVTGVSVSSVSRTDGDTAVLTLAHTRTDFDEDASIAVTVAAAATSHTAPLTTAPETVTAIPDTKLSVGSTSASEGDAARITVTLERALPHPVRVEWSTADGTAEAPGDYTAQTHATTTLTLPADRVSETFTVPTTEDPTDENNETFIVTIALEHVPAILQGDVSVDSALAQSIVTIMDDDDPPALSVDAPSVAEGDTGTATLTFSFTLEPASEKTVTASYADVHGGTATPVTDYQALEDGTLTFQPGETSKTVAVTVTGDTLVEGDETVALNVTSLVNTVFGAGFAGTGALRTAAGTITNDDTAPTVIELSLDPASVAEDAGAARTVNVTAAFPPGSDVLPTPTAVTVSILPASTAPGGDYTVVPANAARTLTISAGSASATGTFDLTPVDNAASDGSRTVVIGAPTPPAGFTVNAATLTIVDDEIPPTTTALGLSSDSIAEGGTTTLTVTLSGRTTTGATTVTVTPPAGGEYTISHSGSRTIAAGATRTTFTLTAAQDRTDAPDRTVEVAVATTPSTSDAVQDPAPVPLTIRDDDPTPRATLVLTPASVTETDGGVTSTVTATLDRPSSEATTLTVAAAPASGSNPAETGDYTLTGTELTIAAGATTSTGSVVLTVHEDADSIDEGVAVSATAVNTQGITAPVDVILTITDDDVPGVRVTAADPLPVGEGMTATYTVALNVQPTGDVTVRVTPGAGATVDTDAVSPGDQNTLTFTADDWNTAQTVTVTGAEDDDAADESVTIRHAILRAGTVAEYDSVIIVSVEVTVDDDDTAGIVLSETAVSVNEGATATWTVALAAEPTASVRIALDSADPSAVTVSPSGLTFTRSNWNRARTVTVRGVDDPDADSETVAVTHAVVDASSADEYDAVADADVTVTTVDDDTPGLRVGNLSRTPIPEGGTATYPLRLNTAPAADVVVRVTSNNSEVTVRPTELTFTPSNWDRDQTVTVAAASDGDTADDTAVLTHAVLDARSASEYRPVAPVDLEVRVDDDDVAGVTLSALSPSPVAEGASALYTVVLDAQPTANVVIDIASDNEVVTVDRNALTFTTGNWDRAQTVTVRAVEDADAANDTATLTHTVRAAASADEYDAVAVASVSVAVDDNDDEGVTVRAGRLALVEGDADAGSATYTLVLDAWPEGSVWVEVSSSDPGAVRVSPDHVRFTGLDLDHPPLPEGHVPWNVPQRVTVTAVDDADGNAEAVTITHRVVLVNAGPAGGNYDDPLTIAAVRVTVADDDPPPALGQVTGVGVSPGVEQLSVRWRAVEGAERYTVQWRSEGEGYDATREATVPGNRTTYTIPGLTVGTQYTVRVIATNAMGEDSPPSVEVPGTPVATLPPPPPPPPPTGVDVSVADARAREGEPVTFTVRLVGEALSSALALAATPSSGPGDTATADTDYAAAVQHVSIAAGQSSATFSVATVEDDEMEAEETFTVTLSARPGAVLPAGVRIADATATGTIVDDDATSAVHHLPLFVPAADALGRQSFARIVNESHEAGEVRIDAFDDEGMPYGPLTLHLGAHEVAHFNSDDLESGNPARGLDGATGAGEGRWRLALTSDLDLRVLSYLRTRDGGLASMHDLVPRTEAGGHRVVFFNPASNTRRVSALRLINPGAEAAEVVIEGTDGAGESPGTAVSLSVPARGARRVTAQALESDEGRGEAFRDLSGALGDGAGKWRLAVRSDQALQVMSLVSSPAGHLNNLSTAPGATATDDEAASGVHHLPLFVPTSDAFGRQSFARIVNDSDVAGEVRIDAFDDTGEHYGPLTLYLGAREAVQFNSRDLETGNPDQGLDGATGAGEGRWRLALTSDLDLEVLGYLRMGEGGLSSMHDLVPRTEAGGHRVVFFNPASAMRRFSALRLVNPGTERAEVVIEGTDDTGASPGSAVHLSVPAGGARMVTARALESADARGEAYRDLSGALGDGAGKWRLVVSSDEAIQVMSLVSSPAGHLNNLSTAPQHGAH